MEFQLFHGDDDCDIKVDELLQIQQQDLSESEAEEVYYLSSDDEDEVDDDYMNKFIQNCTEMEDNENESNNSHLPETEMLNDQNRGSQRREMCINTRKQLAQRLLTIANQDFELPWGSINKLAAEFNKHRTTISNFWNKLLKWQLLNGAVINVRSNKPGRVGRKEKVYDEEHIKSIPQEHRTTIRAFAAVLQVSESVIVRMLKKGIIRSHTNNIKPSITTMHKIKRMEWIISKIIPQTVNQLPRFELLTNLVHIDEKWFWLTKLMQRYYLLVNEEEPLKSTQSKNFSPKVMFIAAVARPQFDGEGNCIFYGKIGIWPFTEEHIAKRSTSNREKGTVEVRALHSVTRNIIREVLIKLIIPTIKEKLQTRDNKCIWIQQDNARPHISRYDREFMKAANTDGYSIHLIRQPAQSPDLNVLDLRFFNAIQSIQEKKFPKDLSALIKSVKEAYNEYDVKKLHYNWLQLQYVMKEILKVKGGNEYKNPHKGKAKLERIGELPYQVEVEECLLNEAVQYLNEGSFQFRMREVEPDEVPGYEVLI